MEWFRVLSLALHFASRALLLAKLGWRCTSRSVSLVSQEMILLQFVTRYLDLLFLFVSFSSTALEILQIVMAASCVVLIRFSAASSSYEPEYDTIPRAVLIAPCVVLACIFHKVFLPMELCRAFSYYLEAVVLIPQFYALYKRQKYDSWVVLYVILSGGDSAVQNIKLLSMLPSVKQDNPYGLTAAVAQLAVFAVGLALLVLQKTQLKKSAPLNEQEKPSFDAVWEAGKFDFDQSKQAQQQNSNTV